MLPPPPSRGDFLSFTITNHSKQLGHRYFYSAVPLDDPEALIDPAVLKSVAKAGGKRILNAKTDQPAFSGNVTEIRQPRTLAFA